MADESPVTLPSSALKKLNKSRTRKINISEWKDNKRKCLRDSGHPYISKRKQPVPGKMPSNKERVCSCKFQCGSLTTEDKLKLFTDFYASTYDKQTEFLSQSCIVLTNIKRRTTKEQISRRQCSFEYFLPITTGKIKVCQKTLCDSLKITPRRLQCLQDKLKLGKKLEDNRGKHSNRPNKIPDNVINAVKSHIESFPRQESHYSRHKSERYYLSEHLNIRKMYSMFCEKSDLVVSESIYRDIFRTQYNISFGAPRSDACSYCDKLYIKLISADSEEEIKKTEIESRLHHTKSDAAYKSLSADSKASRNNRSIVTLCIDLQQVLFCPQLNHSSVFYQRQFSCYNLAIHNSGENTAFMCFWHESMAKRGSADISSCVLKYICSTFHPLIEGEERRLILWSDRCVGQNNNWRMISMLQHLVTQKYFTTVEQKFLVTGHSFLPCDRDFALIERNKKNFKVYEPDQWIEVIATARASGFEVCKMEQEDFKDLTIIENSLNKASCKITNFMWLQICHDDPTTLRCRKSHNILQPWDSFCISKKQRGGRRCLPVNVKCFPRLYSDKLPIKAAKFKDLQDMCEYIPLGHQNFYKNLTPE